MISFQTIQYDKEKKITMKKPDKHYLRQIVKFHIHNDKSY